MDRVDPPGRRPAADWVAIILAVGMAAALNIVTVALLYAAMARHASGQPVALSENGVQLLTGWGGAIVGVLGAYIGYAVGRLKHKEPDPP